MVRPIFNRRGPINRYNTIHNRRPTPPLYCTHDIPIHSGRGYTKYTAIVWTVIHTTLPSFYVLLEQYNHGYKICYNYNLSKILISIFNIFIIDIGEKFVGSFKLDQKSCDGSGGRGDLLP